MQECLCPSRLSGRQLMPLAPHHIFLDATDRYSLMTPSLCVGTSQPSSVSFIWVIETRSRQHRAHFVLTMRR